MATYEIPFGWTAPVVISLLSKGKTPTGTMDGFAVEFLLWDRAGHPVDSPGGLSVTDSANWEVTLTPGALAEGIYHGRISLTDINNEVAFMPSGDPDVWVVRPIY